jgi:hypothetical protein
MTQMHDTEICDGCGTTKALQAINGNELCNDCESIAQIIKSKPDLIKKLCALTRPDFPFSNTMNENGTSQPGELPEVLDAVRFRTRDRELNTWYVSVSEMDGNPVEVFASTAFDRDQHLQSRISNLTTITRLISLILRHVFLGEVLTLEKTLKQLRRSSRQKSDLPDMLSTVLSKYRDRVPKTEKN